MNNVCAGDVVVCPYNRLWHVLRIEDSERAKLKNGGTYVWWHVSELRAVTHSSEVLPFKVKTSVPIAEKIKQTDLELKNTELEGKLQSVESRVSVLEKRIFFSDIN